MAIAEPRTTWGKSPASRVGSAVTVHIPKEQVLGVLKLCRDAAAARQRSHPESARG